MSDEARVFAVAKGALALEEPERTDFVSRACAQDPSLRARVEALIAQDQRAPRENAELLADPAASAAVALGPGTMLAHFRLGARLGEGGMGEVWAAEDLKLHRGVAIKLIRPDLLGDARLKAQFTREALAVSRLNHPNITTIHAIDSWQGRQYLVFEYLEGETLRERLAPGPLPEPELLRIACPLARALAFAHDRGIVHRDLKPGNVMFTEHDQPKLLDFGLAKALDSSMTLFGDRIAGTPAYMSPEQARGDVLDASTDVWSFGALLHHMATGALPYAGTSPQSILGKVRRGEPPGGVLARPRTTPQLDALIARCMSASPSDRPADMHEVARELEDLARGPAPRALSDLRVRLALVAVVLIAATALLTHLVAPPDADERTPLAILTFEVSDEAESLAPYLADSLRDALSRALEPVHGLSIIEHGPILRAESTPNPSMSLRSSGMVAGGAVLEGRIETRQGQLIVQPRLRDVDSDTVTALPERPVKAAFAQHLPQPLLLSPLIGADLARALGVDSLELPSGTSLAEGLTESEQAYHAFVEGQIALVDGDWAVAAAAFLRALAADEQFHWARLRYVGAARFAGQEQAAVKSIDDGVRLVEGTHSDMAEHMRAVEAYMHGDYESAYSAATGLMVRADDDREALYLMGEIATHWASHPDPDAAQRYMLDALDGGNHYRNNHLVYNHMILGQAFSGDMKTARSLLARWRREADEAPADYVELILDVMEGDPAQVLARFDGEPLNHLQLFLSQGVAVLAGNIAAADGMTQGNTLTPISYGMWGVRNRADVQALQGKLLAATVAYGEIHEHAVAQGFQGDHGFLGGIAVAALHAHAQVLAWSGELEAAAALAEGARELQPNGLRALFIAGGYAARAGQLPAARGALRALRAVLDSAPAAGRGSPAWVYEDALAAEIDLAEGDPKAALHRLERHLDSPALGFDWYTACASAEAAFHDVAVRAARAAGDREGEVAALTALVESGYGRLNHPVLYVQSLLDLGLLLMEDGRRGEAEPLLERYLERWGEAMPLPYDVQRARAALEG